MPSKTRIYTFASLSMKR